MEENLYADMSSNNQNAKIKNKKRKLKIVVVTCTVIFLLIIIAYIAIVGYLCMYRCHRVADEFIESQSPWSCTDGNYSITLYQNSILPDEYQEFSFMLDDNACYDFLAVVKIDDSIYPYVLSSFNGNYFGERIYLNGGGDGNNYETTADSKLSFSKNKIIIKIFESDDPLFNDTIKDNKFVFTIDN